MCYVPVTLHRDPRRSACLSPTPRQGQQALALVRDEVITLSRLFALLAANPARVLGLEAGVLAVGHPADLLLFDADAPWRIDAITLPGEAGNTPFDGLPVQGRALRVWKGGREV